MRRATAFSAPWSDTRHCPRRSARTSSGAARRPTPAMRCAAHRGQPAGSPPGSGQTSRIRIRSGVLTRSPRSVRSSGAATGRWSWCSTASDAPPIMRLRTPLLPPGRRRRHAWCSTLRGNAGGDFDRMRRVASLFAGAEGGCDSPATAAAARADVALPAPLRVIGEVQDRRADRPRHGEQRGGAGGTAPPPRRRPAHRRAHALGKDWLTRLVPVDHDWRLAVPAERIEVPGETLAHGLVPDIETGS